MPNENPASHKNGPIYGWYVLAAAIISAVVTLLVYIPALANGFVSFDDWDYITQNPFIRRLGSAFFQSVFTQPHNYNWHPLTMLSYGIDYALWGLDPFWYHLENVLFHSANTLLAGLLGARLVKSYLDRRGKKADPINLLFAALVTALLFGLHPIHVESVAWISERKDVLFTFFFLLSLLSYLSYARAREAKVIYYLASLFFFGLSIMSKPMAVTLPLILIIIDYCPLERRVAPIRSLIEKTPFLALSALSGLLTIWAQSAGGAITSLETYPFSIRLLVALRGYAFYLYKLIVPTGLVPLYPYPENASLFGFEYLGPIALIIIITAVCIATFRRYRFLSAAWAFYLITLLPVIGIVQVGSQSAADRYMYISSVAPFLMLGILAGYIASRPPFKKRAYIVGGVTVILATVLSVMTVRQIRVWKDPVTMWSHVIKVYPDSHLARYNLGGVYKTYGEFDKAIIYFTEALAIKPGFSEALNNRGAAYIMTGDNQRAVADITKAIDAEPRNAEAHYNRAIALENLGLQDDAIASYKEAAALGLIQAREKLSEMGIR
ncbi:MAG: tetratricopeptide repeat protein [Deltaproteobacteria bacterium]